MQICNESVCDSSWVKGVILCIVELCKFVMNPYVTVPG